MKKILTFLTLALAINAANAQMKVGSSPTTISANSNLEVQATDGTLLHVNKDNGKVGIGTSTPTEQLDVEGNLALGTTSATLNGIIRRKIATGALDIYGGTTYSDGAKIALSGENGASGTGAGRVQIYYGGGTAGSNGETYGVLDIRRRRSTGVTPILYVNESDNLGIGTVTPELNSWTGFLTAPSTKFATFDGGSQIPSFQILRNNSSSAGGYFNMLKSRNGGPALNNDEIGYLNFGFLNNNSKYSAAATIRGSVVDNTDGAESGRLIFNVKNAGAGSDIMTLVNSNVGLGTYFPAQKLHVVGNIQMVDGNQGAGKLMVSDVNGKGTWTDATTALSGSADVTIDAFVNDGTNSMVKLGTKSDGTTARDAVTDFVVKDNGYVGIGTSSPGQKMEVIGRIKVRGFDGTTTNMTGLIGYNASSGRMIIGSETGSYANGTILQVTGKDFGTTSGAGSYYDDAFLVSNSSAFTKGFGLYIDKNANAAMGFSNFIPRARLDINGYVVVGSSDNTADASATPPTGAIRFNGGHFQGYNGTAWVQLD